MAQFIKTARHTIINTPFAVRDISSEEFDELYENISNHWKEKAQRLQARRWRKIKYQID